MAEQGRYSNTGRSKSGGFDVYGSTEAAVCKARSKIMGHSESPNMVRIVMKNHDDGTRNSEENVEYTVPTRPIQSPIQYANNNANPKAP